MKVTIKKIAEMAGVSRGTVDRVLHNRPGVKKEVRKKVEDIVDSLSYKPNMAGRALANQKNPIIIGVIICGHVESYVEEISIGIEDAYEKRKDLGLRIIKKYVNSFEPKILIETMRELEKEKINGIILRPIEDEEVRSEINRLVDKGIQIVAYNSDMKNTKRLAFVGQDLYRSGRTAGDLMGKLLCGKGKILIITGSLKVLAHNQRLNGFVHVMRKYFKDIEVIDAIENLEDPIKTYEITENFIKSNKIDGIYVTAGCLGEVAEVLKEKNLQGKVKLVGFDFYPKNIKLLEEGIIDFTIGQDLYTQGYKPVQILFDYLFSGAIPKDGVINTSIIIKTRENI